jgi:uncharacterized membrane protein YvlD (DUF360 family)
VNKKIALIMVFCVGCTILGFSLMMAALDYAFETNLVGLTLKVHSFWWPFLGGDCLAFFGWRLAKFICYKQANFIPLTDPDPDPGAVAKLPKAA